MELFSELEDFSDRKPKSFFDSIFHSIMNFENKLVIGSTEINSDSLNSAISESSIENVVLIIESTNSLQ